MLKKTYYYWKDILDKTIPINVQRYIFLISFVIIIVVTIITNFESGKRNNEFYTLELKNKIDKIVLEKDGFNFKIDTNWYLIKNKIVNYISVGDSIYKAPNSLHVIIKDSNNNVKWNSNVNRNIIFKKVPFIY